MFLPSDNHLAYFRTFPCVDVQNCTISDTKTAVVPPFWRFLKVIRLKNSLNVVYFPNSKRPPLHLYNVRQGIKGAKENTRAKPLNIILAISIKVLARALSFSETLHAAFRFSFSDHNSHTCSFYVYLYLFL